MRILNAMLCTLFFHPYGLPAALFKAKLHVFRIFCALALIAVPQFVLSVSLPFHDSFDTTANWTVQQVRGSSWQQGTPDFGTTNSAHSASSCWDVELNAAYRDSSLAYLISPQINFQGEYNAQLSFWQNFNTEDYFDGVRLEFSMNGGSWMTLGLSGDPDSRNWYSRNNIASSNRPAWCGSSNGWIQSSYTLVPLNGYTGNVQFRFVFTSSDSIQADGYSIDDFFIDPAPANDAEILSVFYPLPVALENTFDSIHVVLKNHGSSAITAMNLGYSLNSGIPLMQAWTGNLLPAETDTFRFSTTWFVQQGFTGLCVFTDLGGDGDRSNDTICKTIKALPLMTVPYADDFDLNPVNWYDSSDTGTKWELGIPASGSTSSVHSGTSCWDLNLNSDYRNHALTYLYSSFFDFTSVINGRLSFWQNRSTEKGFDGMCLEYSTDAGMNWNVLGSNEEENSLNWYTDSSVAALGNQPGWDGESDGWSRSSCILSSLNNAEYRVQFRFRFQSDGSNTKDGISIDDFSILPAPAVDLSLNELTSPAGIREEGSTDTIRIRVRNIGTSDISQFTINYGISGENTKSITWNGLLRPSEALDILVDTLIYRTSDFRLVVFIQTTADADASNDTLIADVFGIPHLTPPFANQEESVRNFYTASQNSVWEWGNPQSTIIDQAFDGNKCWKTNLDGDYSNRMNEYLYSPLFDFSNAYNPVLKFNHWLNTQSGMDGGRVDYSMDGGNNWNLLGFPGDPLATNWYTYASIFPGNTPAWSGNTNGYIESTYRLTNLSAYSGGLVQFRFNFSSNDSVTANGWAIDAFRIESQPAYSAAPSVLLDVQNPFSPNAASQPVGCFIFNTGALPFQTLQLTLMEDGQLIAHDTVNLVVPLMPGDSVFYTYTLPWNPAPGNHEMCTRTEMPGQFPDQWIVDDEHCSSAGIFDTLPEITGTAWCDDFDSGYSTWLTMDPVSGKFQPGEWTPGNPIQAYLSGCYNGTASWVTGLRNGYSEFASSALYSPVFLADSSGCYELSFYHRFKTEQFEDGGTVEYSTDKGNSWRVIGNSGEPEWFNSPYITGLKLPPVPGWSGVSNGWEFAKHELFFSEKSEVVFRFRFGSDASVEEEGWQIDQFCLRKVSSCLIGVAEMTLPDLSFFPNPALDQITILDKSGIAEINSVSIENILGTELIKTEWVKNSNYMQFNIADLHAGMYSLKIVTGKGIVLKKFVKR
ncbi:MAG TPA: choice-of-anchor J domain-containing protein [Bacteroidia bacterium]|nr:choice-of-anchor J domain-containing protein [Bacteroidia bacterium]